MKLNNKSITHSLIADTRYDGKTGQYIPTINGIDISPTSFDQKVALHIAQKQVDKTNHCETVTNK